MIDPIEIEKKVYYSSGYKYQLRKDFYCQTSLRPESDIITEWVCLYKNGLMYFKHGYAWDGCSGPTWDDKTNMRGGLVHDGGYQLIRLGQIGPEYKEAFDRELQKAMIEDGAFKIRAWYYYQAVKRFGAGSCQPGYDPYPVLCAP